MKHNKSFFLIEFECNEAGLGWNVTIGQDCGAALPTFQSLKPEDFSKKFPFLVQNCFNLYELKHFVQKDTILCRGVKIWISIYHKDFVPNHEIVRFKSKTWISQQNPKTWQVWCCISVFYSYSEFLYFIF